MALRSRFAQEDIVIRESPNHRSPGDPNLAVDRRRYTHRTHDERTHFAQWDELIAAERRLRGRD